MREPTARESITSPVKSSVYSRLSGALGAAVGLRRRRRAGAASCGDVSGLSTHQPPTAIAARKPMRSHCFIPFTRKPNSHPFSIVHDSSHHHRYQSTGWCLNTALYDARRRPSTAATKSNWHTKHRGAYLRLSGIRNSTSTRSCHSPPSLPCFSCTPTSFQPVIWQSLRAPSFTAMMRPMIL